jgi:hypothetical protein
LTSRIVTSTYRYKRPPRKKKPAAPLEIPAIVTIRDKKRVRAEKPSEISGEMAAPAPANVSHRVTPSFDPPTAEERKSAIVTIRRKPERVLPPGLLPETPEEHKRRGDGADAMFREFKRLIDEAVAKERQ